jgi:menaquinone-dependent protoporphyrinogen oxidase
MVTRILVAYASREGSTAQIAEAIAETLREAGAEVDARPVKEVHDLGGYDALVLGSAVRIGKVLPEAVRFARRQRSALEALPVTYFVGCDRMREDTPQNRRASLAAVRSLQSITEPLSVGLFAGKRDLHNPHPVLRWLLARINVIEGDWRDWSQIRTWATELAGKLGLTAPPAPDATRQREV